MMDSESGKSEIAQLARLGHKHFVALSQTITTKRFSPHALRKSIRTQARKVATWAAIFAMVFAGVPVHAGTVYWDGGVTNGENNILNGFGLGGNGTWNSSTSGGPFLNWWTGTGSDVAWVNANNDTAVFWGLTPSPNVTLSDAITVGGLAFSTTGYSIGGNTITLGKTGTNSFSLNAVAAAAISSNLAGGSNTNLQFDGGVFGGSTVGAFTLTGDGSGFVGSTTVNNGIGVVLSGTGTALAATSGITLNGGSITLTNINAADQLLQRINAAAPITSNGGTFAYTNTSNAVDYTQTLGAVTLASGQLNFVLSTNQASTGSQTLTLSDLIHPVGSTSSVSFSAPTTGPSTTKNVIVVSTASVATPAGQILGPWATVGTTAALQNDYAVYNGAGQIVPSGITASLNSTWTDSTMAYKNGVGGALPLSATTHNLAGLINSGATTVMTIPTGGNLNTYGLLNGATTLWTIAATGTGALSTPTGGGNLFVNTGSGTMTISAPINDNGGAVTLVKTGSGGTLTLSSTTSNFSGGLVINSGGGNPTIGTTYTTTAPAVTITSDANLGALSGGITFNGSAAISISGAVLNAQRTITINNGAIATISYGASTSSTIAGKITGTGGLFLTGNSGSSTFNLTSTLNDFQGPLIISLSTVTVTAAVASLADSATANGAIRLGGSTQSGVFQWSTLAVAPLVLNNRNIDLASTTTGGGTLDSANNDINNTITVNTDLLISGGASPKTLTLQGGNSGNNTFAGRIGDGLAFTSLTKAGSGTWILAGANTYSGATTLSAGTLNITGNMSGSSSPITITAGTLNLSGTGTTGTTTINGGTLNLTGVGSSGTITVNNGTLFKISGAAGRNTAPVNVNLNGTLTLDNTSGAGGILLDRLGSQVISLAGGTLNYISGTGSSTDTASTLAIFAGGTSTVNLTANANGSTVVNANSLVRFSGGTLRVTGANLGAAAGANNTNLVVGGNGFGADAVGGNGAAGSTTITIVPFILGQDTVLVGNDQYGFMTDQIAGAMLTSGLRNLTASEYASSFTDAATTLTNVNLTGIVSGLNSNATVINSLRLDVNSGLVGTGTVTINSGAILSLVTNSPARIAVGTLAFGTKEAIFNTIGDLVVASSITGTGGIIKTSGGTLTLSSPKTYSGPTVVNGGILRAGVAGAFGIDGSAAVFLANTSGTILDLNGFDASIGSLSGGGTTGGRVALEGATLTIGTDNTDSNFSGVFYSSGAIVKVGTGTLTLGGANLYAGPTTISSGTLQGGLAAFLPTGTSLTVDGTLDLNAFAVTVGQFSGSGTVMNSSATAAGLTLGNFAGNFDTTFTGRFNSTTPASLTVVKTGGGTLTLTGPAGTATGTWTLNAGTVKADYSAGSLTSNIMNVTSISLSGGAINIVGRDGANVVQQLNALTVAARGGSIIMTPGASGSSVLNFTGTFTATANGGSLLINAPALTTVTLNAALNTPTTLSGRLVFGDGTDYNWAANTGVNTATGAWGTVVGTYDTITAGNISGTNALARFNSTTAGQTLNVNAPWAVTALLITNSGAGTGQSITLGSNLTLTNGGLLFTGANDTSITGAGAINSSIATNSDVIINQYGAGNLTIGAVIGTGIGAQTLTKAGFGKLTLTGTNTYTGATFLNDGTLSIAAPGALGGTANSAINISDGATLQTTSTLNTGTHTYSLNGGIATFDIAPSTMFTVGGLISGAGGLTLSNSGTLMIGFAATYTGPTYVNAGILQGGVATFINAGSGGNLNVGAAGEVNMNGFTLTVGGIAGEGNIYNSGSGAPALTVGGNNQSTVYSGVLQSTGTPANLGLSKTGNGTLTLNAASLYTGSTNLSNGRILFGVDNALAATALTLGNTSSPASAILDLNGNDWTSAAITFYGTSATQNSQALLNIGTSGVLTLGGTVTFSNNTTAANSAVGAFITGGTIAAAAVRTFSIADSPNAAAELTITSDLTGAGGITKTGAGNLVLAGQNGLTGLSIVQVGTLTAAVDGALPTNGTQRVTATGTGVTATLDMSNTVQSLNNVLQLGGSTTTSTPIVNLYGGTLSVLGGVTYSSTGNPLTGQINGGTLDLGASTGTFTIGNSTSADVDLSISSIITGDGGLNVVGPGTLMLSGASTFAGDLTLSALGVIQAGANNVLPSGAGKGNLVLTSGTFDLNGTTQNVNAVVSAAAGGVIDNTSASVATLLLGNNDASGIYAGGFQNTGAGALSLTKVGTGLQNLTGSLSIRGSIGVTGGTLNLNGIVDSPNLITGLSVAGGAALNFRTGTATSLIGLNALNLGSGSGTTMLTLEAGAATSLIASSTAATTANHVLIRISALAGFTPNTLYTLLAATGGLGSATYDVLIPGYIPNTVVSNTSVTVNASQVAGSLYWRGGIDNSWQSLISGNTNWTTDSAGLVNALTIPGVANTAVFIADGQTGTSLTTTLDSDVVINDLVFSNNLGSGPLSVISITPGSDTSNSLTIAPASSFDGITMQSGSSATVNISSPIKLGASQTWTVADASSNLNISGLVSGAAGVNLFKSGDGTVTLSGAGNTFGGAATTVNVQAGTLRFDSDSRLGNSLNTLSLGTSSTIGTLAYTGDTATIARALVLGSLANSNVGNTISVDPNNVLTLSGGITGGAPNGSTNNGQQSTNVGLRVTGGGTLRLATVSNTFQGDIVVGGNSTLSADGISRLGNAGSTTSNTPKQVFIQSGSTFIATGSMNPTGSTSTNAVFFAFGENSNSTTTLNIGTGATLTLDDAGQLTLNGALNVIGSGFLTLSNQNYGVATSPFGNSILTTGVNVGSSLNIGGTVTLQLAANTGVLGSSYKAPITMSAGTTLDLRLNSGGNFGNNLTTTGDITILAGRTTSAGTVVTQTMGALNLAAGTLTYGLGSNNSTSGTANVTFGATTLNGDTTFLLNHVNGGNAGTLSLGSLNDLGAPLRIDVTTSNGSNGTLALLGRATNFTGTINVLNNTTLLLGASGATDGTINVPYGTILYNAAKAATGTINLGDTTGSNPVSLLLGANGAMIANPIVLVDGSTGSTTIGNGPTMPVGGIGIIASPLTFSKTTGATNIVVPDGTSLYFTGAVNEGATPFTFNPTTTGIIALLGDKNFTGGVTVAGYKLILGPSAVNYSGATLLNGGRIELVNNYALPGNLTIGASPSSIIYSGTSNQDLSSKFTFTNGGTLTIDVVSAANSVTYASAFGNSVNTNFGKAGQGTLTLVGATGGNTFQGNVVIGAGKLVLDFSGTNAPTGNILSSSTAADFQGGTLVLQGAPGVSNSQSFLNGTKLTSGGSTITGVQNGATNLVFGLGTLSRNGTTQLGTIDFVPTLTTSIAVPALSDNISGIVGGWVTVNGTNWATAAGGFINAYTGDTTDLPLTGGSSTTNYRYSASTNLTGNVSANALRFTTTGLTLGLGTSNLNLSGGTGGILLGLAAGTITGTTTNSGTGFISAAGELLIYVNNGGTLTIGAGIGGTNANFGVTKSGSGTLALTNAGTTKNNYTGATIINGGILSVTAANVLGASSGITLNGGTLFVNNGSSSTAAPIAIPLTLGLNGGTLQYMGTGSAGGWTSTAAITLIGAGSRTLTLGGIANNRLTPLSGALGDNGGPSSLVISSSGDTSAYQLNGANSFSGSLTINRGIAILNNATALPGFAGLTFNGGSGTDQAVLELTGTSGATFSRELGSLGGQVQWLGNGGFSSGAGTNTPATMAVVNLGGLGAMVTWGSGGFVPDGSMLTFNQAMGTTPSVGAVDFQNDIDFGNILRMIDVENGNYAFNTAGTAASNAGFDAKLSGALTSDTGGGFTKVGGGVLWLTGNNAGFLGSITVTSGTVLFGGVDSLSGSLTLASSTTTASGAVLQGSTNLAELIAITTPTSDGALLLDTNSSDKIDFQAGGLTNARFGAFGTVVFQGQFKPGAEGAYNFNGPLGNNVSGVNGLSVLVLPHTDAITGASSTVDFGTGYVLVGSSNNYGDATHGTTLQIKNVLGSNAGGVNSIVAVAKDGALGSGTISFINNQSATAAPTIALGAAFGDHTLSNNLVVNNTGGISNFNFVLAGDTTSEAIPSAGRMTYTGDLTVSGTSNIVLNPRTVGYILNGKISGSSIIHISGGSPLVVFNNLNSASNPSDYSNTIVYLSSGVTFLIGNSRDLGNIATNRVISWNSSAIFGILPGAGDITTTGNITFGDNGSSFNKTIDVPVNQTFKLTSGLVSASRTGQLYTKTGLGTFDIGAILNPGASATATWGTAGVNILQGTLKADFVNAVAATNIIGLANNLAAPLTLSGGTMLLVGKATTANSQAYGTLVLPRGANALTLNSNGGTLTTSFTQMGTRAAGATLAITLPTDGPAAITVSNGLVAQNTLLVDAGVTKSPFAVIGTQGGSVTDWAAVSGTSIVALTNYTDTTATTISGNATVATGVNTTLAASANADSIRFRLAEARTLNLGGNLLRVGGVLVTSAVGTNPSTISNGSLTTANGAAANADLVFYQDNVGGSLTVSADIVDNAGLAAALTKSGLGEVVLSGTNTYTGATFLNEGMLTISKVGALGSGAGALNLGGGTLNYTGTADASNTGTLINAITLARSSTVRVETNASLILSGTTTGTLLSPNYQVLTKTGAGMLTLAGTVSNVNLAVDVAAGTLLLNKNGTLNSLGIFANNTLSNVGLTVRSGAIARLGGDQVFGDQIANSSSVQVLGTLDLSGHNETIDGLGGNGIITNTASSGSVLTVGTASMVYGAPTTFAGTIQNGSGTVGLSMIGGNIFTLSGTNTYTGKTSIVGQQYGTTGVFFGGISISNASGLGGNPTTFTADQWMLNGGRLVATGDVVLDASRSNVGITLGANGGTFEVADTKTLTVGAANTITGAGNLIKEGPGSLTLLGVANTYTGTTILNGGTLTIASEGALGLNPTTLSPTQLTFNGGSLVTNTNLSLDDSNRGLTIAGNGGTIAPAVNTTLTLPNNIAGNGNFTVNGAGTVVVSAANSFTGSTFVTSGTLISGSNSLAATAGVAISGTGRFIGEGAVGGPVSVGSGGSLSVGTNPTNTGSDVGSITIATSGEALTWSGGGTITFDFSQNPLGVGGAGSDWDLISLTAGHLSIEAGITNKITIDVNAFVHNTSTPGPNGSGQEFDPALAIGESYQWLFVQGATGPGGAVDLNGYSGDVNDLFTVDSSGVFGAGLYDSSMATGSFYVSVVDNALYINYSAVPEPGSLLLIGIASAGLFGYRRRKRRKQDDTNAVVEAQVAEGNGETVATPVG